MKRHAAWFLLVLVACNPYPHVQLGPLPPQASPGQRVQIYNELHGTVETEEVRRSCTRGGCSTSIHHTLYLANGTEVHHPEDLLPVVNPGSPAARSARAAIAARRNEHRFTLVGLAGILAFGIVAFDAMRDASDDETFALSGGQKLALVASGIAALVGVAGGYAYHFEAAAQHGAANRQYNEGLAQQLRVCVDGLFVRPCEAAEPAPPPPGMAPPGMAPPDKPPIRLGGS